MIGRSYVRQINLAIASLLLLTGCSRTNTPAIPLPATVPAATAILPPASKPVAFTILHTNDSSGYVDPCG